MLFLYFKHCCLFQFFTVQFSSILQQFCSLLFACSVAPFGLLAQRTVGELRSVNPVGIERAYNQILSGGNLNLDLTVDSNFEKENNNKWLSDASLITNYNQNLNEKFKFITIINRFR